jgi:hypothetical protein
MLLKLLVFFVSVCKPYRTITFLIFNHKKLRNTSHFVKKLNFSSFPFPTTLAPFDCTLRNPTTVRILILDITFLWTIPLIMKLNFYHIYKIGLAEEEYVECNFWICRDRRIYNIRRCNLREVCHCAVSIRVGELAVTLDICSRGYLQVKHLLVPTG